MPSHFTASIRCSCWRQRPKLMPVCCVSSRARVRSLRPTRRAQLWARRDQRRGAGRGDDPHADLSRHHVGQRRSATLVGHVLQRRAGGARQHFAGQVLRRAVAGRGIRQLAGLALGQLDELGHVLGLHLRVDGHDGAEPRLVRRQGPDVPVLELVAALAAVRDLRDLGRGRNQPPPVRRGGRRIGNRGRPHGRILGHGLRAVLPGRIRQHDPAVVHGVDHVPGRLGEEEQKKRDAAAPANPITQYPGQPGNAPEPLR